MKMPVLDNTNSLYFDEYFMIAKLRSNVHVDIKLFTLCYCNSYAFSNLSAYIFFFSFGSNLEAFDGNFQLNFNRSRPSPGDIRHVLIACKL